VEVNLKALHSRAPQSPALDRYREVARILTGNPAARASDGVSWLYEMCGELEAPPLRRMGLTDKELPPIADQSLRSSSMKGNPVDLTAEELTGILRRAL
jgi:alcohol dehydrogenase class IV